LDEIDGDGNVELDFNEFLWLMRKCDDMRDAQDMADEVNVTEELQLKPEEVGSPKDLICQILRKKRGTLLRAWRMDIDTRAMGKVSYTDFVKCCRNLGAGAHATLCWNSLQLEGQPLNFSDLAEEESENLEALATCIWQVVGGDFNKAWEFMDSSHQNWIMLEEFSQAVKDLGFDGDAKLLFRGLDTSRLGKLRREDFLYIRRVSHVTRQFLDQSRGVVTDLITWAKREQGGSEEFLAKLGLGINCPQITLGDLAARLAALGFDGDAREAAIKVARMENGRQGGTMITLESLQGLLSGLRTTALKGSTHKVCKLTIHYMLSIVIATYI